MIPNHQKAINLLHLHKDFFIGKLINVAFNLSESCLCVIYDVDYHHLKCYKLEDNKKTLVYVTDNEITILVTFKENPKSQRIYEILF